MITHNDLKKWDVAKLLIAKIPKEIFEKTYDVLEAKE